MKTDPSEKGLETLIMRHPTHAKIYHILHVDRLESVIADGGLWSDAVVQRKASPGTTIGMSSIKQRRLTTPLTSHPTLTVGQFNPSTDHHDPFHSRRYFARRLRSDRKHGELRRRDGARDRAAVPQCLP